MFFNCSRKQGTVILKQKLIIRNTKACVGYADKKIKQLISECSKLSQKNTRLDTTRWEM